MAKYTAVYQGKEVIYDLEFRKTHFTIKINIEDGSTEDDTFSGQVTKKFPDMKEPIYRKEYSIDHICDTEAEEVFEILAILEKYE